MLLQAAIAAMVFSSGIVFFEMRRIDDRYVRNQEQVYRLLNQTDDQIEQISNDNRDLKMINKILNEDVNNLHSTMENHEKELDLYKDKGKEEE